MAPADAFIPPPVPGVDRSTVFLRIDPGEDRRDA